MSDAPDELESAMILGDPGETVSLDTIKAMARAVRDAGYVKVVQCDHQWGEMWNGDYYTRSQCTVCKHEEIWI